MRRVVVTGATSFIATALIGKLIGDGFHVCAVVRPGSPNLNKIPIHPNVEVIELELTDIDKLEERVGSAEGFFHFAWEGTSGEGRNDAELQQRNIDNTLLAVEVARKLGCRCFVGAGSQAEYGVHKGLISEKTECNPLTEYGRAKLEAGRRCADVCERGEMKYLHLRIFSVYGAGDHPWTLVSQAVSRLCAGEDMPLTACSQMWNFLHVADASDQILALYEAMLASERQTEIYNIASLDTRVLREFTQDIRRIVGGSGRLLYGEIPNPNPVSIEPDISKLIAHTGWSGGRVFGEQIKEILKREYDKAE